MDFASFPLFRSGFIRVSLLCLGMSHAGFAGEVGRALIEAIKSKDHARARQLLEPLKSADRKPRAFLNEEVENDGKSLLILALEGGVRADILRLLLDQGVDVNLADREGKTPLILAAQKGQFELMQVFLKRGAQMNHQDRMGWTALTQSLVSAKTEQDQFRFLKLCIENGAELDSLFPGDRSAYADSRSYDRFHDRSILVWAIETNALRLAKYLLSLKKSATGASQFSEQVFVNQLDGRGRTPLIQAAASASFDWIKTLLDSGAHVTAEDHLGWTALSQLMAHSSGSTDFPSFPSLKEEQVKWMKVFLEKGANPYQGFPLDEAAYLNRKDGDGFRGHTLLTWAVENDRADIVLVLLEHGVDLGPLQPLLMSAMDRGNLEIVKLTAQRGVQLCPKESIHPSEHTPLTLAIEKGKVEVVRFILDFVSSAGTAPITLDRCHLNALGKEGLSALGWAAKMGNFPVAQLLVDHGEAQYFGASELRKILEMARQGSHIPRMMTAKWIKFFALTQTASNLNEILNLKSECMLTFEGAQTENELPDFSASVSQLKNLMNLKARKLYYIERELEIQRQSPVAMEVDEASRITDEPLTKRRRIDSRTIQCVACLDELPSVKRGELGPSGCSCSLCEDCAPSYCDMIIHRDGEDLSLCPGCKNPLHSQYLVQQGRTEEEVEKIRSRIVDQVNARQQGWVFCPCAGCAGGRVLQPDEKSAYYSCFLCGHEGCIRCGKEHQGECSHYEKQMKGVENLLRLGAEAPLENRPSDENHPDYYKGRFRPCYHCGVITERSEGCNQMICSRCNEKWDWNNGPEGRNGDYTRGEMRFTPLKPPHF